MSISSTGAEYCLLLSESTSSYYCLFPRKIFGAHFITPAVLAKGKIKIFDPMKNNSPDSETFLFLQRNLCRSIGVDPVNHTLDSCPKGQICENLHDAAPIREGRLLEHRQILHHAVVDDVLYDLVDKVDLPAVQVDIV